MTLKNRIKVGVSAVWISAWVVLLTSCESELPGGSNPGTEEIIAPAGFPDFITPTEEYFNLTIAGDHNIDSAYYYLKISGAIETPANFSLEDLRKLEMVEKTVTVECIGNPVNGKLVGTATWKGFRLYDLLDSLGIKEEATFVKYLSSDGYFTYNTLEELQNYDVFGALEMNGEIIPPKYGFPLRIIFPGFYGVRHPGWIVEIELLDRGIRDYWGETQVVNWNTDSSMHVDSKFFFPRNRDTLSVGEPAMIGGTAFGSKRIAKVEITDDDGATWIPATITHRLDKDYVWVFWEVEYTPSSPGKTTFRAKATGQDGRTQPREDKSYPDGINNWPDVTVFVKDSN